MATSPHSSVRVLLVDRERKLPVLAKGVFESGALSLAGPGCDFSEALEAVNRERPHIVLMDFASAGLDVWTAIEDIMAERPTPILAMHPRGQSKAEMFRALYLGALDLCERQENPNVLFWRELERKLVLLSRVRVVQHVKGHRKRKAEEVRAQPFPLVAIASSLGGPKALAVILGALEPSFPAPIVICQHISSGFTEGLAQWLATETRLKVVEGRHGEPLKPGTAYIAPSRAHMLVAHDATTVLDEGPALDGFRPSCDALLASVAESFRHRAIGVILTGMGKDGARGLKEIRVRGGRTIAQNQMTCAVFGMPREAIDIGAAEEILPLDEIAAMLEKLAGQC